MIAAEPVFPGNEYARTPLTPATSNQRRFFNDQSEQSGSAEPEPGSEARSAGRRPEARPAAAGSGPREAEPQPSGTAGPRSGSLARLVSDREGPAERRGF